MGRRQNRYELKVSETDMILLEEGCQMLPWNKTLELLWNLEIAIDRIFPAKSVHERLSLLDSVCPANPEPSPEEKAHWDELRAKYQKKFCDDNGK